MTTPAEPLSKVHLPAAYEPLYLPECDSVLEEAVRRARAGAPEGTLIWAGAQTDARGRLGTRWLSPPGGLHCALVLRPELAAPRVGEFIPLATVALGAALAELVTAMTDLRYRWPNAVYLSGGRVAGVWLAAGNDWLVLASAINVMTTAQSGHYRHACISMDGGNPEVTVPIALEAYVRHLTAWLACWDEESFMPIVRHFRHRAQRYGETTTVYLSDGAKMSGRFVAIDDDGALRLDAEDGSRTVGINEYMGLPSA